MTTTRQSPMLMQWTEPPLQSTDQVHYAALKSSWRLRGGDARFGKSYGYQGPTLEKRCFSEHPGRDERRRESPFPLNPSKTRHPPQWNEFSWTRLILERTQCGEGREALTIYKEMRARGIAPMTQTFIAALKACISIADLDTGREIHGHILERGALSNVYLTTTLVDMYAKCGSMVDARRAFENMPCRNVVTWNAVIRGYVQQEAGETALELFERMQNEGLTPDDWTFVAIMKACVSLAAREESQQVNGELLKVSCLSKGRAIHSQITKGGLELDAYVATTLIDMYAKCGSMVDARHIFENMPCRDVVAWNSIIMGYALAEDGKSALQLYMRMQREGFKPTGRTFVAALKSCGSLAAKEEGTRVNGELVKPQCLNMVRTMHSQITMYRLESDVFVATTLVDAYAKCGSMTDASQVFEKMPSKTVVSWNAMIMGYTEMEKGELALRLYGQMSDEGFTPDTWTFATALKACSMLACLEAGKEIHAKICNAGLKDDVFLTNCLIDMYAKCGSIVDAQQLFDASPVRNLIRWNSLIAGYSNQGDGNLVFDLFNRMQQEGIQPTNITFLSILAVCSHTGLLHEGQMYFQIMCSEYGLLPANEHYRCMVDLLARAGKLDEAVAILKRMPFKPDIVTWKTILGACQKWNTVEVGKYAFECAVKLDDKQLTAYVLINNIYASTHKWEDSANIQAIKTNAQKSEATGLVLAN